MNTETIILISTYAITILLLLVFVSKEKIRDACLIFLFKQAMTWILGLAVVQIGLIDYPIRSFPVATRTSFDFEYFFYPAICVIFNLHFPKTKNFLKRFMYYFHFCTAMSIIEAVVEKYTEIITYIHWSWYITWATLFMTFYFSRMFYLWFFRLKGDNISNTNNG